MKPGKKGGVQSLFWKCYHYEHSARVFPSEQVVWKSWASMNVSGRNTSEEVNRNCPGLPPQPEAPGGDWLEHQAKPHTLLGGLYTCWIKGEDCWPLLPSNCLIHKDVGSAPSRNIGLITSHCRKTPVSAGYQSWFRAGGFFALKGRKGRGGGEEIIFGLF